MNSLCPEFHWRSVFLPLLHLPFQYSPVLWIQAIHIGCKALLVKAGICFVSLLQIGMSCSYQPVNFSGSDATYNPSQCEFTFYLKYRFFLVGFVVFEPSEDSLRVHSIPLSCKRYLRLTLTLISHSFLVSLHLLIFSGENFSLFNSWIFGRTVALTKESRHLLSGSLIHSLCNSRKTLVSAS